MSSLDLLLKKLEKDGFTEIRTGRIMGLKQYKVTHNPSEIETCVEVRYVGFILSYIFDFHGVEHGLSVRHVGKLALTA